MRFWQNDAVRRRLDQALTAVAIGFVAALGLKACVAPAEARVLCTDTDTMLRGLQQRYGEEPAAAGVTARGDLVTLTVAEDGSWTVLVTKPGGLTCALTGGEGWEEAPAKDVGEGLWCKPCSTAA